MTKEERLKAAEAYIKSFRHQLHLGEEQSVIDTFIKGAEAEAESKWISVEDRLPEVNCECIVYHDEMMYFANFYKSDNCFFLRGSLNRITRLVTHWQPLPEPPLNQQR